MKNITFISLILLLIAGYAKAESKTYDWRYDRTGKYMMESNLLKTWPEEGPELVWKIDSGLG